MPPLPRALCHECGREVAIRQGGELREHRPYVLPRPLEGYDDTSPCPGSGQQPMQLEEVCGLLVHPAASAWPLMPADELEALADDIRDHGLREPVKMRGGLVIDGRNRLLACELVDEPVRFDRGWVEDATAYVLSANLHRRHLTSSQRAMIAARLLPVERELARARMEELGRAAAPTATVGAPPPTDWSMEPAAPHYIPEEGDIDDRGRPFLGPEEGVAPNGATGTPAALTAPSPTEVRLVGELAPADPDGRRGYVDGIAGRAEDPGPLEGASLEAYREGHRRGSDRRNELGAPKKATEAAAERVGVGARQVERAAQVLEQGSPELVSAVDRGEVAVAVAADLSQLPQDEQRELIETADPAVLAKVARDLRDQRRQERRERAEQKRREQAAKARQASPEVVGVELWLGRSEDMIRETQGAGARLVHTDPPWLYDHDGNGAASSHYEGMEVPEIVDDLEASAGCCGPDALLVVWCTWSHLPDLLLEVEERRRAGRWSWGAPYTGGAWTKTGRVGTGRLWRGCTEPVVVFERGRIAVCETIENGFSSVRGRHSEKPEEWLEQWVRAWVPEGALVLDLYAGLAPMARVCARGRRRYIGIELDPDRRAEARAELARVLPDGAQLPLLGDAPEAVQVRRGAALPPDAAGEPEEEPGILDLVREGIPDAEIAHRLRVPASRVRRARHQAGLPEGRAVTS